MTRAQLKRSAKGERKLRVVAKVGGRKRYTRHDAAAALLERVKESTRGLKESGDPIRAIRTKIDACLDATPIFSSGWMDRQDRIVKAAAAVNGGLMAEARLACSRADVERVIGTLALAIEEDVEPLVALEQAQEAFKVVAAARAAETQKYVAALRLLERVRSSALELTADGNVIENLGKITDSAFDANRANPSLSIDDRIEKGTRLEMGGYILKEADKMCLNLEWSEAHVDAIYGLIAVAIEDDSNPLVALEKFQEAVDVVVRADHSIVEDPMLHLNLFAFGALLSPLVSDLLSFDWPPDWRAR